MLITNSAHSVDINIVSSQGENNTEHRITPLAITFSKVLQSMIGISADTSNPIPFDFSDTQIRFVAELLNFIADQSLLEPANQRHIMSYIREKTDNFSTISFADALYLSNFFDISLVYAILLSVKNPLPLPTTPVQAAMYNRQLAAVFNLAKESTTIGPEAREAGINIRVGSEQLWQLFGRMLYPGCLKYPEINAMIDFITAQRGDKVVRTIRTIGKKVGQLLGAQEIGTTQKIIESIVLTAYMQQHPELYAHSLESFSNGFSANSVTFSPDGQTLASGSNDYNYRSESLDYTIRLWRVTGSGMRRLIGHTDLINSIAFSPDGETLASGSSDNTIRLWRVADGLLIRTLTDHTDSVFSVAFSPDGQTLAAGSRDNTIRLWRVADGSLIRTLTDHTDSVFSVAFSPDGQTLAAGSNDATIRLWCVADGSLIQTLTDHTGYISSIAFSPDGETLAAITGGRAIKLWRVADGSLIRTLKKSYINIFTNIISVAFSPDSQALAAGINGSIILWGHRSLREALTMPLIPTSTPAPSRSVTAPQ